MACGVYWNQLNEVTKALRDVRRLGLPVDDPVTKALNNFRGSLLKNIGLKRPRTIMGLLKLFGLSPGTIHVMFDPEGGFVSVARKTPGAEPVTKYIDAETAVKIITRDFDHALENELMTPDPYIGE